MLVQLFEIPGEDVNQYISGQRSCATAINAHAKGSTNISSVIKMKSVNACIRPATCLIIGINARTVSFRMHTFRGTFFVRVANERRMFRLFISIECKRLMILNLSNFMGFVGPIYLIY